MYASASIKGIVTNGSASCLEGAQVNPGQPRGTDAQHQRGDERGQKA